MEKNSFKKRIAEAVPGLIVLPIILVGMLGSGCEGEHDLLTTGFNCENPFHVNHSTCGTTTVASSSTTSFLSPNQG
jgi:hypothetical protein